MDNNEEQRESNPREQQSDVDLEIPGDDENDMSEWWTWGNFARLFIVPLVIVIVAVFVYGFFQFMVRDDRAVADYIKQVEQGTERGRWRAAFDLAQQIRNQNRDKELTMTDVRRIVQLYQESDQPRVRMYLARVLGHVPSSLAKDALVEGLDDPDPGVRINTMVALGEMEARATAPHIAERLEDDDPGVRRMAAYILGSMDNQTVIETLKTSLDDAEPDVRWNVAISLARLGNEAGRPVLIDILGSAADGKFSSMDPEARSNLLVNTLKALGKIGEGEQESLLTDLHENDPSPAVRRQALELLQTQE